MLVWTRKSGVPDWLAPYSATKRYELLKARVKDVVKVHASTIDSWVVVNEPIMCRVWGDTTEPENRQEKLDRIVPYVHDAFVWSHRANPTATLILNEYRLIAPEANRRRFIGLVRMLQEQNTPISVLGIQGHEPEKGRYWYSPQQLWETYDELGALGCPLYITEFLPHSSGKPISGGWRKGLWNEQTQAEFGEHFYRLSFGHPAVSCIVWFGLSDADVVYPGGGLLDKNYRPKKAWTVLKRLIHEEWTTRASGGLTADGAFRFRGFYGRYELRLRTADGKEFSFRIHVQRDQPNRWTFPLPAP
jgi:GH35 family endo-1,4-beta-xylanase